MRTISHPSSPQRFIKYGIQLMQANQLMLTSQSCGVSCSICHSMSFTSQNTSLYVCCSLLQQLLCAGVRPTPFTSRVPPSPPRLLDPSHCTAVTTQLLCTPSSLCVQVYAACGHSSNGSIRVIQADQTVDTLYESGADYPGISGMWSIPPWPGAEFHSLLVLSFASGSRAMATGAHSLHLMQSPASSLLHHPAPPVFCCF